jgi:hypothetical protein
MLRHFKDIFKIGLVFQNFDNVIFKMIRKKILLLISIFSSDLNPRYTIKFALTLTTVVIIYMKCQFSRPNPCFTLCLLERRVPVTTYDFGFMDDSITN